MHIIQGDLILHKRTLEPIKTVVYGLRRYDDDRVAAMSEKVDPTMKIQGYMSHKAKIYLVRALYALTLASDLFVRSPRLLSRHRGRGRCTPFVVRFAWRARPASRGIPLRGVD